MTYTGADIFMAFWIGQVVGILMVAFIQILMEFFKECY